MKCRSRHRPTNPLCLMYLFERPHIGFRLYKICGDCHVIAPVSGSKQRLVTNNSCSHTSVSIITGTGTIGATGTAEPWHDCYKRRTAVAQELGRVMAWEPLLPPPASCSNTFLRLEKEWHRFADTGSGLVWLKLCAYSWFVICTWFLNNKAFNFNTVYIRLIHSCLG